MIDLGLTKLAVIGVVALVVIGPEKLPKVARMAGTLYGRAQRYLNEVKSEVSREIELEELKNLQKEVQAAAESVKADVESSMSQHVAEVENAWHDTPTHPLADHQQRHHRRPVAQGARSSAAKSWCAIRPSPAGTSSVMAASCM